MSQSRKRLEIKDLWTTLKLGEMGARDISSIWQETLGKIIFKFRTPGNVKPALARYKHHYAIEIWRSNRAPGGQRAAVLNREQVEDK